MLLGHARPGGFAGGSVVSIEHFHSRMMPSVPSIGVALENPAVKSVDTIALGLRVQPLDWWHSALRIGRS